MEGCLAKAKRAGSPHRRCLSVRRSGSHSSVRLDPGLLKPPSQVLRAEAHVVAQAMVWDLARTRLCKQPGVGDAEDATCRPGVDQAGVATDRLLAGDAAGLCEQARRAGEGAS